VQTDTPTKPLPVTAEPLWKQWAHQYLYQETINCSVPTQSTIMFCQCCGATTLHKDGTTSWLSYNAPYKPQNVSALPNVIDKDGIYFGNGATTEEVIQLARLTGDLDGLEIQDGDRLYSFVWRDH
jgi:uncharacterized protein YqjF (DUF2071 family)